MIPISEVIEYHNALIDDFGGSKGIRDVAGLEAAIARPYATFDQQELYTSPFDKAAAIFESLVINHPFVDGNKRIAYAMMLLTLMDYDLYVAVSQSEQYEFVISASTGEIRFDEIKAWLETRATKMH